jgi:hypothetical protein
MPLSEKTFELNYTADFLRLVRGITGLPVSAYGPSAFEEAQLGFDARMDYALGIEFYVQYKRPKRHPRTGDWTFRINEVQQRNQHQLLHTLAQRRPTRYCFPLFDDYMAFRLYGGTRRLLWPPFVFWCDPRHIAIPANTRAVHTVHISAQAPYQLTVHSEPTPFKTDGTFGTFLREIVTQVSKDDAEREEDAARYRRETRILRPSSEGTGGGRGSQPPVTLGRGEGDDDGEGAGTGLVGFTVHRSASL